MSLKRELYYEKRRRLRRRAFFKGFALSTILFSAYLILWRGDLFSTPHIAVIDISGEIFDDPIRDTILHDLKEDENVFALLVRVNSPGGSVVGAEAIYDSLRTFGEEKPIVVSIGEVGASAAYIASLAGDKIFARGNSLVGSIGVIVQYPNLSELAERFGVSIDVIKSGDLKGGANIFTSMNEEEQKAGEALVNDSFLWFKRLVSERREINVAGMNEISDGRLFTGRMALHLGLVDFIGSSNEAISYLKSSRSELTDLPVKYWSTNEDSRTFWTSFFGFPVASKFFKNVRTEFAPILLSIAG